MIKVDDINLLDWHRTKYLSYMPEHFAKVDFMHNAERSEALLWMIDNIRGRFAIVKSPPIKSDDTFNANVFSSKETGIIGFEDHSEATMYALFFNNQ